MKQPTIVFAHGAGAPSTSAWMVAWRNRLETIGPTIAFDFPYMMDRRKRPDPLPRLVESHRAAVRRARELAPERPVVLAGKSMGSRVGCHLSLEEDVAALVCFGYPLLGMGKPNKLRDAVLVQLRTPVLFVQGTRDKLCPLDRLEEARSRMTAPNELHVVTAGDHSLAVTKSQLRLDGETEDDVAARILAAVADFVARRI